MKKNKQNVTISDFYCVECGKKGIPVPRKGSLKKEAGHLKKLYCLHCQKETNHAEVRPYGSYNVEDFQLEFEKGRFINGNRIPITELLSCSKIDCEYNVNGKCWNATQTFDCGHRIIIKED